MKYIKLIIVSLSLLLLLVACQVPKESKAVKRPNILFAIADDASFPHMGAYGTTWIQTPAFDKVANEGILFMNAYTPNSKCAPSRSIILTGRNSWQLEEAANHTPHFPAKFKTFMESLGDNGYFVGHTQKGWGPGNPGEINGKPRKLTGPAYSSIKTEAPTKQMANTDYAANFGQFLKERPEGQPFCFWYGASEPHRRYEFGSGISKGGKKLSDIEGVPAFWPDNDSVRTDMLDYAYEIEYFDQHLQKMINMLEEAGELDNTIIVITADNGMPFPRSKGQSFEVSCHLPLAVMWKGGIKNPGRKVEDFISFADFAPTFLDLAGVTMEQSGMQPIEGKSIKPIFLSQKEGKVTSDRDFVILGKERHDVGRPHDQGYPIRGIRKGDYLYLRNYEPSRWPAGNPETGYTNTDGGATKTVILNCRTDPGMHHYWQLNFGKRMEEELYHIGKNPACIDNLAVNSEYSSIKAQLRQQMEEELKKQNDPRMFGKGHIFDQYEFAGDAHDFYERYMSGEKVKANWVNEADFEKEPLD